MPIRIEPYSPHHISEVQKFNLRLREGGAPAEYVFFETVTPDWLPAGSGHPIFNELFLATDGTAVRGAYALKTQPFKLLDGNRDVGFYHHPFSEGIVSRSWGMVGALLLNDALRRQPLTYCLGMGGYDRPLPRMLIAMKWKHFAVPFRFYVLRPSRFLRGMTGLRYTSARRHAMDLAAWTGVGLAGFRLLHWWKRQSKPNLRYQTERVPAFGNWADELWDQSAHHYPFIAVRDRASLQYLFPETNPLFQRIRVIEGGKTLGWAVVTVRQNHNHPQYGNLRTGWLVDALAVPEDAPAIVAAALNVLRKEGADVVLANHSHREWVAALDAAGFLTGPSNFIFAGSPALVSALSPFESHEQTLYFTRADGDGLYRFV